MQNIINGIDKATQAGVFNLDEVLSIAKSIESLAQIVKQHQNSQQVAKQSVQTPNKGHELPEQKKKS